MPIRSLPHDVRTRTPHAARAGDGAPSRALVAAVAVLAMASALACAPRGPTTRGPAAGAPAAAGDTTWVASWSAAPQRVEPHNLPPAPGLAGHTLRQVVHLSLGGRALRVRVTNAFGDGPLTIGAAHVAHAVGGAQGNGTIDPATDRRLTFGGEASVTVPAGATALSDPVAMAVPALADLAVTLEVTAVPPALTGHPGSRTTSYVAAGAWGAAPVLPDAARVEKWYLLSGLDVLAAPGSAAVVTLGNSITDGRGSGTDRNGRWPDHLARRLQDDPRTAHVAVVNAGIGGNTVLAGGLGPTMRARFDRDVLAQPGARWVIVLAGVNDIGGAAPAAADSVATRLIAAHAELVARAHARGLRAYGATILPFGGSFYDAPERERARQRVNAWIRTGGVYDAVLDLDAVMRDPAQPTRLRAEVDGGDHLHPNAAGYRAMGEAVPLALFHADASARARGTR